MARLTPARRQTTLVITHPVNRADAMIPQIQGQVCQQVGIVTHDVVPFSPGFLMLFASTNIDGANRDHRADRHVRRIIAGESGVAVAGCRFAVDEYAVAAHLNFGPSILRRHL